MICQIIQHKDNQAIEKHIWAGRKLKTQTLLIDYTKCKIYKELLLFQLCLGCWKSRPVERFEQHPSGNRRRLCYLCRNSGVIEPKTLYTREQNAKPLEDRMRICTICLEEKNLILDFQEQGYLENWKKKYSAKCATCRNSKFRTPEHRAYANSYMEEKRKKPGVIESISEYNKQ